MGRGGRDGVAAALAALTVAALGATSTPVQGQTPPAGDKTFHLVPGNPLTRVEAVIRQALASSGGASGAPLAQAIAAAIHGALGNDPRNVGAAIAVLNQVRPADFSDPAAVGAGLAIARKLFIAQASKAGYSPAFALATAARPTSGPVAVFHHDMAAKTVAAGAIAVPAQAVLPPPPPPPPPPVSATDNGAGTGVSDNSADNTAGTGTAVAGAGAGVATPTTGPAPAAAAIPGAVAGLTVSYNAPSTLPLASRTDFRLYIDTPGAGAGDFNGLSGPVDSHAIPAARVVKAVLSGPTGQVDIDGSGSPACQTITPGGHPVWDWYVTPKTTGRIELKVDLWAVNDCSDPAPALQRIDSFDIPVTATAWEFVLNYAQTWQGVLAAIFALIAAGGAAFGAWRWLFAGKGGGKD